jgi:hypothetical protein
MGRVVRVVCGPPSLEWLTHHSSSQFASANSQHILHVYATSESRKSALDLLLRFNPKGSELGFGVLVREDGESGAGDGQPLQVGREPGLVRVW